MAKKIKMKNLHKCDDVFCEIDVELKVEYEKQEFIKNVDIKLLELLAGDYEYLAHDYSEYEQAVDEVINKKTFKVDGLKLVSFINDYWNDIEELLPIKKTLQDVND